MVRQDRAARQARAGFLCGLISFMVTVVAALGYLAAVHSQAIGALTLLAIPAFPVALVGVILSFQGRHASARRGWAIAGMALSVIGMVPFLLLVVAFGNFLVYCSFHSCF